MSLETEFVVIGAGVIGIAIARELSMLGHEVVVLEKEKSIGRGISSRNSEVVHAGMYYRPESLKAIHCVRGKRLLYQYCKDRHISYAMLGKLIVASNDLEMERLDEIKAISIANGLNGQESLRLLDRKELKNLEPNLEGKAALLSPSTGIIDSHSLLLNLQQDAEDYGATFCFDTIAESINKFDRPLVSGISRGDRYAVRARHVIVCAGIQSAELRRALNINKPDSYWLKGSYFRLTCDTPFRHLVYPLPNRGGLGIHFTLDLAGQGKFGPDTEKTDNENYCVSPCSLSKFELAIRRYWPELPQGCLEPDYAGIRPKLRVNNDEYRDFLIMYPNHTRTAGLTILDGIESPGLTACLSIAAEVCSVVTKGI